MIKRDWHILMSFLLNPPFESSHITQMRIASNFSKPEIFTGFKKTLKILTVSKTYFNRRILTLKIFPRKYLK